MKYLPLVLANLGRDKKRTTLTVASVALALFLFASLQTVVTTIAAAANFGSVRRLVSTNATGIVFTLPIAYANRLQAQPGVESVTWANWFGGRYGDGKRFFATFAIDPKSYLDQWIKAALDAELAQMDAAFDFPAGLQDVYARAGLARPGAKREGDLHTPSGTFGIGYMFGWKPDPGVKFRYRVAHGYDMKWLHREILNSDTYQRSWKPNDTNRLDEKNFSHAVIRRLPAEVVFDAIAMATASAERAEKFPTEIAERSPRYSVARRWSPTRSNTSIREHWSFRSRSRAATAARTRRPHCTPSNVRT